MNCELCHRRESRYTVSNPDGSYSKEICSRCKATVAACSKDSGVLQSLGAFECNLVFDPIYTQEQLMKLWKKDHDRKKVKSLVEMRRRLSHE